MRTRHAGTFFRGLRGERTQRQFGSELGCSESTVSRIENEYIAVYDDDVAEAARRSGKIDRLPLFCAHYCAIGRMLRCRGECKVIPLRKKAA